MKKFLQIWFYFLILAATVLAIAALYLLRYAPLAQFVVVTIFASFYFLSGVAYHIIKGDLKREIVLEFGGIAVFVILSFAILTFWRIV